MDSLLTDCPAIPGNLSRVTCLVITPNFFSLLSFSRLLLLDSLPSVPELKLLVFWVMNSKHCSTSDMFFIGPGIPSRNRPNRILTLCHDRASETGSLDLLECLHLKSQIFNIQSSFPWLTPVSLT